MPDLWSSSSAADWRRALRAYEEVIGAQGVESLPELDSWYRTELPAAIASRAERHVTHEELVHITRWKMARGVWRARNLVLVRGNDPAVVLDTSRAAIAKVPHPTAPISGLAQLAGVGPATASAVMAAAEPGIYPFLDELIAAQVPGLGEVAYTMKYYGLYADALRDRAREVGGEWTAVDVERALWATAGGKAGVG